MAMTFSGILKTITPLTDPELSWISTRLKASIIIHNDGYDICSNLNSGYLDINDLDEVTEHIKSNGNGIKEGKIYYEYLGQYGYDGVYQWNNNGWISYRKELLCDIPSEVLEKELASRSPSGCKEIHMESSMGTLIAYTGCDPQNPSIGLMFKPHDENAFEIDLTYAEAKSPELSDEETLSVYTWKDIFSEEYADSFVIKKDDVKKLMEMQDIAVGGNHVA